MASLWAAFVRNKRSYNRDFEPDQIANVEQRLNSFPPRLVNAQGVIDEVEAEGKDTTPKSLLKGSWDATPCYQDLWLEWIFPKSGLKAALAVTRFPAVETARVPTPRNARFMLRVSAFCEYEGSAGLCTSFTIFIDNLGEFLFDTCQSDIAEDPQPSSYTYLLAEILTAMNTRGTRIEPPLEERHNEVVRPDRPPHSVWHTIHLPRFAAPPLENAVINGAVLEKREHWVRAHRADYRKGLGLFGRVRALVWVPEHKRGNPELGTVKQSFIVHPRENA